MPPKKAKKLKGVPKKAPVTGGVVNRIPEDGLIEAHELPQRLELLHGPEMSDPGVTPVLLERKLTGDPQAGYVNCGPGWARVAESTLRDLVQRGEAPPAFLRPMLIPCFSNTETVPEGDCPIGGPGWEHDIEPPAILPGPDHICTDQDPYCTFPQRWLPIREDGRSTTVECGIHACRPQDPWCQSGHRGRCPLKSDYPCQVPIINCWCPECQTQRGYRCLKEWTGPCILPERHFQLPPNATESDSSETGSESDSSCSSEDCPERRRRDRTCRIQCPSQPIQVTQTLPKGVTEANIAGPGQTDPRTKRAALDPHGVALDYEVDQGTVIPVRCGLHPTGSASVD